MENAVRIIRENKIKFIVATAILVISITAVVIILVAFLGTKGAINNNIIVYEKNNQLIVNIDKLETVITDSTADSFICDSENNRVFYTVASSYSDGLYDLYYIEKHRSELTKPRIIDYGIEKDYVLSSGKIFYLKNNSQAGANEAYVCDFENSTIKPFSTNVESIYPLDNSDIIYFIKLHGNERVLHKYSGDASSEVDRNISAIHLYNNCEKPHILYESDSMVYNGMTELFIAYSEGAPELICDNTHSVMYDEYSPDGNLYYFTSSSENISWSYVISDSYADSDKTITRPKRDSFLSILGISVEYNQKLREYQDKLVRDEIRAALNESVEKGDFSAPVYTAFAYNSDGSHKIAENIDPSNVLCVSPLGNPKLIYEGAEITENVADISSLVDIAQRSAMAEVIEYARSVVKNSVKTTGIKICGCNQNSSSEYLLEGYDKTKTSFSFSVDGNRIFALVRDSAGDRLRLYSCQLGSDMKPSQNVNINNGIFSYYFIGNSVVYMKSDIGKNTGDIYLYDGNENIKLSNAVNALKVDNSDNIVILKNYDETVIPKADYYMIKDGKEELIAENILVDSFNIVESGKSAFIINSENERELKVYYEGSSSVISDDVSEIVMYN